MQEETLEKIKAIIDPAEERDFIIMANVDDTETVFTAARGNGEVLAELVFQYLMENQAIIPVFKKAITLVMFETSMRELEKMANQ